MNKLEEIYESLDADIKSFSKGVTDELKALRKKPGHVFSDIDVMNKIIIAKMKKEGWTK